MTTSVALALAASFSAPQMDFSTSVGLGNVMPAAIRAQVRSLGQKGGSGRRPAVGSSRAVRTTYVPSLALRKKNVANFLATVKKHDPQAMTALSPIFVKQDPIKFLAAGLAKYGLKTNDVADATATYLASAWYGANGRLDDIQLAQARGLRNQMSGLLRANPSFAKTSNAGKQTIAESCLFYTILNESVLEGARRDKSKMPEVSRAIAAGARNTFGLDLTTMKLTSAGLVN